MPDPHRQVHHDIVDRHEMRAGGFFADPEQSEIVPDTCGASTQNQLRARELADHIVRPIPQRDAEEIKVLPEIRHSW